MNPSYRFLLTINVCACVTLSLKVFAARARCLSKCKPFLEPRLLLQGLEFRRHEIESEKDQSKVEDCLADHAGAHRQRGNCGERSLKSGHVNLDLTEGFSVQVSAADFILTPET